jgi:hypothetical protein
VTLARALRAPVSGLNRCAIDQTSRHFKDRSQIMRDINHFIDGASLHRRLGPLL